MAVKGFKINRLSSAVILEITANASAFADVCYTGDRITTPACTSEGDMASDIIIGHTDNGVLTIKNDEALTSGRGTIGNLSSNLNVSGNIGQQIGNKVWTDTTDPLGIRYSF